jgi:hypothetical protein
MDGQFPLTLKLSGRRRDAPEQPRIVKKKWCEILPGDTDCYINKDGTIRKSYARSRVLAVGHRWREFSSRCKPRRTATLSFRPVISYRWWLSCNPKCASYVARRTEYLRPPPNFTRWGMNMEGQVKFFLLAMLLLGFALLPNTAHAYLVCGTATVSGGGVTTAEPYCYDNGIPNGGGGGGGGSGGGSGGGGGGPSGGGFAPMPTAAQQDHDKKCANTYGSYKAVDGVPITFSENWAFAIDDLNLKLETTTKTQPPPYMVNGKSYDWVMIDADTLNWGQPGQKTIIYRHANVNMGNMVNTLAHEFAHQHGKDDDVAEPTGDAAEKAYNGDGGAQCK